MSQTILDEHLGYWRDNVKLARYRQALVSVMPKDARVLDLGSGTGLLAFLACEAGAGQVIAVESGPLAGALREVVARNGLTDRIEVRRTSSIDLTLDTAVDLIVGDQLGGLAYTSGAQRYYADAARRLLRRGGATIPSNLVLFVAAIEHDETRDAVDGFAVHGPGYDLETFAQLSANTVRVVRIGSGELCSAPVRVHECAATDASPFRARVVLEATRSGRIDGLLGMFRAELSPGVHISNIPGCPDQLEERWQDLLPLTTPLQVRAGDHLHAELMVNPDTYLTTWRVGLERDRAPTHSTFHGRILDRESLAKLTGRRVDDDSTERGG